MLSRNLILGWMLATTFSMGCERSGDAPPPAAPPPQSDHTVEPAIPVTPEPAATPPSAATPDKTTDNSSSSPPASPTAPRPPSGKPITFDVPVGWEERPAKNSMRVAEFVVPGPTSAAPPAELVITAFPPTGMMGDINANIDRWRKQLRTAEAQPIDDAALQRRKVASGNLEITIVEGYGYLVVGTAMGGTGAPTPEMSGLLGAIAPTADMVYFLKLTGPEATVRHAAEAFDQAMTTVTVR